MKKAHNKWLVLFVMICISNSSFSLQNAKQNYPIPTKAEMFVTAKEDGFRLAKTPDISFSKQKESVDTEIYIFIDPLHTFQTILGIGGALTDASAEVFAKLPENKQQEFMQAYYDKKKGIGYSLARTNIASCDFSTFSYSYVKENDSLLKTFSVKHDEQYRIPFIKKAITAAGGKLTIFASPWSPPAWMKDNNDVLHGGSLLPKYRQAWANYFVKFINAYEKHGIPIWGVTDQNEPKASQTWESCIYTPEQERDFIKYFLGPTFKKSGLEDKKIIVYDHNRDFIYEQASTILNDREAAKFIWGVGYHWYEYLVYPGSSMQFENLRKVKDAFPDKNLLFTEGCMVEYKVGKLNDWSLGEKYGYSMVNDFNCGAVGWTDWNVLLDENGGPNHVNNYCFAPIHANTKKGELIYTNIYYYIGHFSKFIRPGAKRISSSCSRDKLLTVAFLNPDGKIVIEVLNLTNERLTYNLWLNKSAATVVSLPHSMATIII